MTMSDDELVELYRDVQAILRRGGAVSVELPMRLSWRRSSR
jgi:hypothetical protein